MHPRSALLRIAFIVTLASTAPARADLLIGDFSGGDTDATHSILRFRDSADGNATALSSFTTTLGARLQTPFYLTYEPVENVLYVADFYGKAIRVYSEGAQGETAPLRTLTSSLLGQPRRVAVSVEHDEIYAAVSGCCLAAYPRTASGDVAALRFIQWGGGTNSVTRLNNPTGPVLRNVSDTLIVGDNVRNADNTSSGVLLSFARNATGNAAPASTLEGNLTRLGQGVIGPAYDELHDEVFVVGIDVSTSTYRILTFAGSASGNVAPLRSIEGTATMLKNVSGIEYDAAHDTIFVAEGGYNGALPYVLAFSRTANGNVAPSRTLAGANTQIGYPIGIAVTQSSIFQDGFE